MSNKLVAVWQYYVTTELEGLILSKHSVAQRRHGECEF